MCSAGASPQMTLVSAEIDSAKISTGVFSEISASSGNRVRRHERQDRREPRVGERGAEHAGGEREQQALRQQLPNQPAAARAERHPNASSRAVARSARDSSRFETFAQAMSSSSATAPSSTQMSRPMRARERFGERQQADAPLVGKLRRARAA